MVSVEAELKAVVRDVDSLRAALDERASAERAIYSDRYFDRLDRKFTEQGYELRVRTIADDNGTRVLLTYKEPAVDVDSGSKPEHEAAVGDADTVATVLMALGAQEFIAFEKQCVNYRFAARGRDMLATLVTVPELDGQTFIELETIVPANDVNAALDDVRFVLCELGITSDDFTTEAYTDAVAARRSR